MSMKEGASTLEKLGYGKCVIVPVAVSRLGEEEE